MCKECLRVSYLKQASDNNCPHCAGTLEPLNGFYDRHPSLRDKTSNE